MAKSYPALVTNKWLVKYMIGLHYANDVGREVDSWQEEIPAGDYKLVRVPLTRIKKSRYCTPDEDLAESYSEIKGEFPPIVLDDSYTLIDGQHRALAAEMRGDKDIRAYVPVKPNKRAMFISVPLGQITYPTTKVAVSVPELVAQTNAFSVKRRPGCTPSLLDSNPKQLFLRYNVKCKESYSDPNGHDVTIKFDVDKVEDTQNANDLDVHLNCSCPAFLYWGAQWNLHQRDGLLGDPRPELAAPTKRLDLRKQFVICKHCKAVLERILPSVQHNIQNIIREKTVQKNKEQLKKQPSEKEEKLKKEQDAMKKRQELKKLRETKNKDIQQKLLDALREKEEKGKAKPEEEVPVVERDENATEPLVVETPKTVDVTKEEPHGEEDLTGLVENEENKLKQEEHKKLKNQPHLHKGLPYETEQEKKEHGHNVPSDEDLLDLMRKTKEETEEVNKKTREFIDSGGVQKYVENKRKRKQTSLELSILAKMMKDVADEI
jgi:hypothetical protein